MATKLENIMIPKVEESHCTDTLDIQRVQHSLRLEPFLNYVEQVLETPFRNLEESNQNAEDSFNDNRVVNGKLYNFTQLKKGRKWLKNIVASDTSSSEDEAAEIPEISITDINEMLRLHAYEKKHKQSFYADKEAQQCSYYSSGLLSNYDKYSEKSLTNKAKREQRKMERKLKKMEKLKKEEEESDSEDDYPPKKYAEFRYLVLNNKPGAMNRSYKKEKRLSFEQMVLKRRKLWIAVAKKEIPKAQKIKANARKEMLTQLKKVAKESQKDCRKQALQSQKVMKEAQVRARRLCKEMQVYWKRFDKVEKEHRRKAEKEALEQRKVDVELNEMKRQQRKLNFLITQTELYAHFMARKMTGATETDKESILSRLDEETADQEELSLKSKTQNKGLIDLHGDNYDTEEAKEYALRTAQQAYDKHKQQKNSFLQSAVDAESELANPTISTDAERPQPSIFEGKLKGYQLKGMNWLANLYEQGINGILADEMGLGKTVQSLSLLAYLAESLGIWGPFLIVSPASTLHNWQQELSRFTPKFKVVPYWGNTQDRKVLRKFWNQENLHSPDASFHVVVTSYQLVIQDVKYFSRIKWHYMILDEAQAIKSQQSVRWKILLDFKCRNRLLLTGTPIQNTMQELWALLHFIMPTLFDSHDEFSEWFSKDIESHAEKQSGISEKDLSRLHMILKPFMLRRIKKDVENELSDKIEILVYCPLTARQRLLYQAVKNKIRVEDLLQSGNSSSSTSSLMNLVMQFRKVCNHPELFERKEVRSPFYLQLEPFIVPKLVFREALLDEQFPSQKHLVLNKLYIHNSSYVHSSLFTAPGSTAAVSSSFSFTRFINTSPAEWQALMLSGLLIRWLEIFHWVREAYNIHHNYTWKSASSGVSSHISNKDFYLEPLQTTYFTNIKTSQYLKDLVFTEACSDVISLNHWILHSMPETISHRKIRLRRHSAKTDSAGVKEAVLSSPGKKSSSASHFRSQHKVPVSPNKHMSTSDVFSEENIFPHKKLPPKTYDEMPTSSPSFLYHTLQKTRGLTRESYCSDRRAEWRHLADKLCGSTTALKSLLYGTPEIESQLLLNKYCFFPTQPCALTAVQPKYGYSGVFIPDKETLITDAGKLYVLDTLLNRLKSEGHRVLIYSQMTRMIDILEEYMWHRKHTYMRLDGSSKISERRDMVADFQSRSDIFAFLLSTRAGGLGINLTAADTVIFYDSDWNPTVDQQAMDRAHRLGQTKQVTVYRLICGGTIEERILQRAKEKSEIQKMVISGGNYKPDILRPKEVVSLLLDDDELEKKLKQKSVDEEKPKTTSFLGVKRKLASQPKKSKFNRTKKRKEVNNSENAVVKEYEESVDASQPASPYSASGVSEFVDESSNDASQLNTDDIVQGESRADSSSGRTRGRRRGRGSVQAALSAAEAAAMHAGISKGYAAYGYTLGSGSGGSGTSTPINTNTPVFTKSKMASSRSRSKHSRKSKKY